MSGPAWAWSHSRVARGDWNPGVSTKRSISRPSMITGKERHTTVSPGRGVMRTVSSSVRVDTTDDFPSLGCPTTAKVSTWGASVIGHPQ